MRSGRATSPTFGSSHVARRPHGTIIGGFHWTGANHATPPQARTPGREGLRVSVVAYVRYTTRNSVVEVPTAVGNGAQRSSFLPVRSRRSTRPLRTLQRFQREPAGAACPELRSAALPPAHDVSHARRDGTPVRGTLPWASTLGCLQWRPDDDRDRGRDGVARLDRSLAGMDSLRRRRHVALAAEPLSASAGRVDRGHCAPLPLPRWGATRRARDSGAARGSDGRVMRTAFSDRAGCGTRTLSPGGATGPRDPRSRRTLGRQPLPISRSSAR